MDGDRFDQFTRAITRDTSRRGFLKKIGAGIAGVLGTSAAVEETQAGPKKCKYQGSNCKGNADCCSLTCCNRVCCGDGQVCCNGQCVRACPSGQALDGACTCQSTTPACTSAAQCPQSSDPCRAAVCVGGQCGFADLNGFACDDGNPCTTGTTCQNGTCTGGMAVTCNDNNPCTADTCNPASGCVHTPLSDVPCAGGTCQNGTCIAADPCAGIDCDDGNPCTTDACSNGTCTHTAVAAGTACAVAGAAGSCDADGACVPFVCEPGSSRSCYTGPSGTADVGVCRTGTETCHADGSGYGPCVGEVTPSAERCDGLDNDCDGAIDDGATCPGGAICAGGACVCPSGTHACGGVCVSDSSPQTCGASCTPCPTRPNSTPTCVSGTCGISCYPGFRDCNGNPTDGCEVNTQTDGNNCGGCGIRCDLDREVCTNGICVCRFTQCNGVCCSQGQGCFGGYCIG